MKNFNSEIHEKIGNGFRAKSDGSINAVREILYSAFLDRFKVESLVAIQSSDDVMVKVLEKKLESKGRDRGVVQLDDPDLRTGLEYYDSQNLLLNGDTPDSLLANGTPNEAA